MSFVCEAPPSKLCSCAFRNFLNAKNYVICCTGKKINFSFNVLSENHLKNKKKKNIPHQCCAGYSTKTPEENININRRFHPRSESPVSCNKNKFSFDSVMIYTFLEFFFAWEITHLRDEQRFLLKLKALYILNTIHNVDFLYAPMFINIKAEIDLQRK